MRVRVDFTVFGDGALVSLVSGDLELSKLPVVGDRVDIRGGSEALAQAGMPGDLLVSDVLEPPGLGYIVCFEYFDVGSVDRGFEVCRLLQDELDLFCDAPLPFGDKYGDGDDEE